MNHEDVIRMATEAGLYSGSPRTPGTGRMIESRLERFAALVAAAEREACAKVCDDHRRLDADLQRGIWVLGSAITLAAAIRARGEVPR